MRMRYIVVCGLSGAIAFSHIITINGSIFEKENIYIYILCSLKCAFRFFSATCDRNISHSGKNWAKYGVLRTLRVSLVRSEWNLNLLYTFSENI